MKNKKIEGWNIKITVNYDNKTELVIDGSEISDFLSCQIDKEIRENETKISEIQQECKIENNA